MKRFFFAVVVALAFCAAGARAANWQAPGVRVGPLAEEVAPAAPNGGAAKKDEKKAPAPREIKGDRKAAEAKKNSAPPEKAADTKAGDSKTEQPAPLSASASSAVPPASPPAATSDAPDKPRANAAHVPFVNPSGSTAKEAVGPDPAAPSHSNNPSTTTATPSAATAGPAGPAARPAAPLTAVYRIGVGDVLDIRTLNEQDPRQSTLFTVLAGGVLDYPLLPDPLTVAGMTTEELSAQLVAEFRHRNIYDRPQVRVSVREYASHAVLVSGLANDPGTKILRREAVPLYVVIAEAQPKPEAGRAVVISHSTGKTTSVDLSDAAALNMLVQQGDVINLTARPPEFFYAGGEIASPGQKDFHAGMTLTQGLLASGGVTRFSSGRVRVSRQGPDGRLVSTEYNLKEIEDGRAPDPPLQAGDRVEVTRKK
ncbi:MAG TPA: polysaccharide biosynthesis/export family protein [Pyrinomonadaceae bacterium]|nr:polysaccharide biosynthesis/export family protein [Pyrinomonadaceae bacterium]